MDKMAEAQDDEPEDDYMSDKFIDESLNKGSLIPLRKHKRQQELYKKKLVSNPKSKQSMKVLEMKNRDDALSKPIDSQNKGFLLLQKMLNKTQTTTNVDSNVPEMSKLVNERLPIMFDIKSDRRGVGHVAKKRTADSNENKVVVDFEKIENNFLQHKRLKNAFEITRRDFLKCQKVCYNFDQNKQKLEPDFEWYWPKCFLLKKDNEDDGDNKIDSNETEEILDDATLNQRLTELNLYIRKQYIYCIWCGIQFQDESDMGDNCPGISRIHHEQDCLNDD